MSTTLMQAIYESAGRVSETEAGKFDLKGLSRAQFMETMKTLTDGLGKLPGETNLHVVLMALTYLRNAVILTMQDFQQKLERDTGGSA